MFLRFSLDPNVTLVPATPNSPLSERHMSKGVSLGNHDNNLECTVISGQWLSLQSDPVLNCGACHCIVAHHILHQHHHIYQIIKKLMTEYEIAHWQFRVDLSLNDQSLTFDLLFNIGWAVCLSFQVCLTWFLIPIMSRLPHTSKEPTCIPSDVLQRKNVCQGKPNCGCTLLACISLFIHLFTFSVGSF